jgi:hypothetical protein
MSSTSWSTFASSFEEAMLLSTHPLPFADLRDMEKANLQEFDV